MTAWIKLGQIPDRPPSTPYRQWKKYGLCPVFSCCLIRKRAEVFVHDAPAFRRFCQNRRAAAGAFGFDAVDDGAPVEVIGAAGGVIAFGDPGEGL